MSRIHWNGLIRQEIFLPDLDDFQLLLIDKIIDANIKNGKGDSYMNGMGQITRGYQVTKELLKRGLIKPLGKTTGNGIIYGLLGVGVFFLLGNYFRKTIKNR
jgi:hypothetical protein